MGAPYIFVEYNQIWEELLNLLDCLEIKGGNKWSWLKMVKLEVNGGGINSNRPFYYAYKLLLCLMTLRSKAYYLGLQPLGSCTLWLGQVT